MEVAIINRYDIAGDIKNLRQDYVLISDETEEIDKKVLEKLSVNDDVDIIVFDYSYIYSDGFLERKKANTYNLTPRQMIKSMLSGQYSACLQNKIFKKSLLLQIKEIKDIGKYFDLALCVELFSKANTALYIPKVLSTKKAKVERVPGGKGEISTRTFDDIKSYDRFYKKILPVLSSEEKDFLYNRVIQMKNEWVSRGLIKKMEFNKYASIPLYSLLRQSWSIKGRILYAVSYFLNSKYLSKNGIAK